MKDTLRVLVTGAGGFLGANVLRQIVLHKNSAFDKAIAGIRIDSDQRRLDVLAPGSARLMVDLCTKESELAIQLRTSYVDAVINCAAYGVGSGQTNLEQSILVNIAGTARLVQACSMAGVKRFIQVGTGYEYGDVAGPISEDRCPKPVGIYGVTKLAATLLALDQGRSIGLPVCVVRPFGIYGPLEGIHKFVPMVMNSMRHPNPVNLTAGNQIRDYTFVSDVADAILRLVTMPKFPEGEIFNLASGRPITLRDLANAAVAAVGGVPESLNWGALQYRTDESMYILGDARKAAETFGWHARTSVSEGMAIVAAFEPVRCGKM